MNQFGHFPASDPFKAMWDKATDLKVTTTGILIVGGVVPFVIGLVFGFNAADILKQVGMVLSSTTLLWIGCRQIVTFLAKKLPWQHYPVRHLLAELAMIGVYTLMVISLFWLIIKLTGFKPPREVNFWKEYAGSTIISVIISLLHEGVFFYQQWKANLLRSEMLEKENIASRYETLKNQVNPHFLFNSFNTLLTLIEENKSAATDYLESLSGFYRQILQSSEKSVITIEEELLMINTYYDLQKVRFGEGFELKINIPDSYLPTLVAPLTLQMLVENALKHNTSSVKNPLTVEIEITENEYLTIRNNLNRRADKQAGTGTGLQNIINRYSLISGKEVLINSSGFHFTVAVPVIKATELQLS